MRLVTGCVIAGAVLLAPPSVRADRLESLILDVTKAAVHFQTERAKGIVRKGQGEGRFATVLLEALIGNFESQFQAELSARLSPAQVQSASAGQNVPKPRKLSATELQELTPPIVWRSIQSDILRALHNYDDLTPVEGVNPTTGNFWMVATNAPRREHFKLCRDYTVFVSIGAMYSAHSAKKCKDVLNGGQYE